MRIPRPKKLICAAITGFAFIAIGSTALAVPPYKENIGPIQVLGYHVTDCGTFDILNDFTMVGHFKVFFDKDGNWTKYFEHIQAVGGSRYYNSVDPDISFSGGPGEVQNQTWYPDGRYIITGLSVRITIPGHGVVAHEVGRIIIDTDTWETLFQAGPSDAISDTTALCELLSG